jgi:hypothetical protein
MHDLEQKHREIWYGLLQPPVDHKVQVIVWDAWTFKLHANKTLDIIFQPVAEKLERTVAQSIGKREEFDTLNWWILLLCSQASKLYDAKVEHGIDSLNVSFTTKTSKSKF